MAAFRFGLEKVLEHRKESELESARGLAHAREEADSARTAKIDLEAVITAGRSRLAAAHGAGGAVGHLHNLAEVVGQMEAQVQGVDEACREADEQVVESLKSLHHAFRQRKTIEELRERKLGEWRTEEVRDERKAMDEIAMIRHTRSCSVTSRGGE
jgi:flagellar export protein FliJ